MMIGDRTRLLAALVLLTACESTWVPARSVGTSYVGPADAIYYLWTSPWPPAPDAELSVRVVSSVDYHHPPLQRNLDFRFDRGGEWRPLALAGHEGAGFESHYE